MVVVGGVSPVLFTLFLPFFSPRPMCNLEKERKKQLISNSFIFPSFSHSPFPFLVSSSLSYSQLNICFLLTLYCCPLFHSSPFPLYFYFFTLLLLFFLLHSPFYFCFFTLNFSSSSLLSTSHSSFLLFLLSSLFFTLISHSPSPLFPLNTLPPPPPPPLPTLTWRLY